MGSESKSKEEKKSEVVGRVGLEPTTLGLKGRCSTA